MFAGILCPDPDHACISQALTLASPMKRIPSALLLAASLAACSRPSAEPGGSAEEPGGAAAEAIDSEIAATVIAPDGTPAAGVPVLLQVSGGDARWVQQTDSAGVVRFGPGILGSFRLWTSPPDGMKVISPARGDTTITVTRDAPNAAVTFRTDTTAMLP